VLPISFRSRIAVLAGLLIALVVAVSAEAATPTNTNPPKIMGKAEVGQRLNASHGDWSGSKNFDYSYQWLRCNSSGGACASIQGATDNHYTVSNDDVGSTLRVQVTAKNNDGTGTAQSAPTAVVKAGPATPPKNTSPPTISGSTVQGETLTANPGTWSGANLTFTYQWRRCNANGGGCDNTGVTSQTYKLGAGDVGHTMRVRVTATNSAGSSNAESAQTAVVQGTAAPPSGCVPIASVSLPQRLIVDQIAASPSRIHSRSEPLVMRFHVVSTSGKCVSGALVYAVGVPFDRLSKEPEVQTGGDGWASITFHILPTFKLRSGNLVVVFVRARKSGESVLAGVSTRRLVSVRVA
jgi:hypothetical protein